MKKVAVSIFILIAILLPATVNAMADDRVSLGYIYGLNSLSQAVAKTDGNINTVSPTCFDLTNDGHLELNDMVSREFVDEMHEKNVLVTPFLSNHWTRSKAVAALNNAEVLADEIVKTIEEYNLDGVNVDLENIPYKQKDDLTNFMKILNEKMPEEKVLSIAVAANPDKLTTEWVSVYDYEALAKHSDYMVLMAYDEHCQGGTPGPVASTSFVEESVKVVLENVSRDKVVLGMPLYGRFWESGEEYGGEAIVISQVERIASRYKTAVPRYDEVVGTATLTIEVESGDKKAYVNGRYLEEGTYNIWYENEKSYARKMEIMNEYGLRGAALWAIGNETVEFWKLYKKNFENENYESEKQIQERVYYEQIERIKKVVEPLKLIKPIKVKSKLKAELQNRGLWLDARILKEKPNEKDCQLDDFRKDYKIEDKGNEIIFKEKQYKALERFNIAHIVTRMVF